jgi:hypothetical protein
VDSNRANELDQEAVRTLELLKAQELVSVAELRAIGVPQPAQALYALQLAGWPVRRSGNRWRLAADDEQPPPRPAPTPRVRII